MRGRATAAVGKSGELSSLPTSRLAHEWRTAISARFRPSGLVTASEGHGFAGLDHPTYRPYPPFGPTPSAGARASAPAGSTSLPDAIHPGAGVRALSLSTAVRHSARLGAGVRAMASVWARGRAIRSAGARYLSKDRNPRRKSLPINIYGTRPEFLTPLLKPGTRAGCTPRRLGRDRRRGRHCRNTSELRSERSSPALAE